MVIIKKVECCQLVNHERQHFSCFQAKPALLQSKFVTTSTGVCCCCCCCHQSAPRLRETCCRCASVARRRFAAVLYHLTPKLTPIKAAHDVIFLRPGCTQKKNVADIIAVCQKALLSCTPKLQRYYRHNHRHQRFKYCMVCIS
jgi:hypothetical protein